MIFNLYLRTILLLDMGFKRIALFFVLLANTLVLAHSVIPHHHHKGLVVSIATTKSDHNCEKSFSDHSHDNNDDTDCSLRNEILIPGRSFRTSADQNGEDSELNFIKDTNSSISFSEIHSYFSPSWSHSDLSLYLTQLNRSQGLRAPPLS